MNRWITNPLFDVLDHCVENELPALTALVVRKESGMVGPGFNAWLQRLNRGRADDVYQLETVAAQERLKTYRLYCLDVPDNAVPMPTPPLAKKVNAGGVSWPWTAPPCRSCGRPLRFYELCPSCR